MPGALWWKLCARPAMACHPSSTFQTEQHNVLIVGSCQWVHGRGGPGTSFLGFILNAGRLLSNLRPWGPRCFHSPSWRQVTADYGCGPVLRGTPAAALTGQMTSRCYCGDWWWWRRWPRRGLGCNALREKGAVSFTGSQLPYPSFITVTGERARTASLILRNPNPPPALWLCQRRTEQTNTLTRLLLVLSVQRSQGHELCTCTHDDSAQMLLTLSHQCEGLSALELVGYLQNVSKWHTGGVFMMQFYSFYSSVYSLEVIQELNYFPEVEVLHDTKSSAA